MKITVVGSGFVGQTAAMRLLEKGLGEVVLVDIIEGKPQGIALDLRQAAPVEGYEPTIVGTNDYADTAGSDVVVITAGFPRQPGMSRMDLLGKNAGIMREVIANVQPGSPGAILIIVSNPLDEMTTLAADVSGMPKERVFGMAGVLDSARLRAFIAEELGVSPNVVEAITLGSHGDAMVALPRHATVDGRPLPELVDAATLERLFQRTRDGGAEIVGPPQDGLGVLRAQRVGRNHGRGDRARHEGGPARMRVDDRRVRDRRRLRGRPGAVGPRRCRGDRGARPGRGGAHEAARGRRADPREVCGPVAGLSERAATAYAFRRKRVVRAVATLSDMHERTLVRAVRSPAATTVFAIVFAMGGLAYAGSGAARAGFDGADAPHGVGRPFGTSDASEHGPDVSIFATSCELVGWRKGAAISQLASGGRSQAGEHGPHGGSQGGGQHGRQDDPGAAANDHPAPAASGRSDGSGDGHASQGGPGARETGDTRTATPRAARRASRARRSSQAPPAAEPRRA